MFVQGSLLADTSAAVAQPRRHLDATSWVDHVPAWHPDPDATFDLLLAAGGWGQGRRVMWGVEVDEPRLTRGWSPDDEPPVLSRLRAALAERYPVGWGPFHVNLYRDGQDAVAWHSDRVGRVVHHPLVATITLGSRRRFLLRRRGGGAPSTTLSPGPGDLLVMGGACQHDWEHCVPRCASAGPRMSITVRQTVSPE